jgi:hypothetical protein
VPFQNNPTLLSGGQSDIAKVIPVQDAVNKLWTDLIVASEYQGFRQRWATGIEIPTDPETGQPLTETFLSSVSRMWTVADEGAKFGEFGQIDLSPYVKAIEMAIQHIAAQTRTPPHYLLGQSGAFPSGESLKATETGLTAKVRRKMTLFGESWEEAMRLAFRLMGDEAKGNELNAETVWQDPESKSEAEITDAALKQRALGVPFEMVWETLGYSQEEIKRMVDLPCAGRPTAERRAVSRGMCDPHYRRVLRDGHAGYRGQRLHRPTDCSVDGCHREHEARGLCGGHYARPLATFGRTFR